MKLLSKIRFLPITIFFAAMMLTIKVSHIWDGIEELRTPTFEVAGAIAQTGAGAQEDPRPDEKPEADAQDALQSDADLDSNIEQSRLITNDPTLLSTAEIELLQHLSIRREEIDKREKEFDIRDGLM